MQIEGKEVNQNDLVIAYIRAYGSITTLEAFRDLGVARLASRICDLKKRGYTFRKDIAKAKNRFGKNVRFTRYSLIEGGEEE